MNSVHSTVRNLSAALAGLSAPAPHFADALSFMARSRSGAVTFWNVEPTGHYPSDFRTGKALGAEFAAYLAHNPQRGALLPSIITEIAERCEVSGIEQGFFQAIANRLTE